MSEDEERRSWGARGLLDGPFASTLESVLLRHSIRLSPLNCVARVQMSRRPCGPSAPCEASAPAAFSFAELFAGIGGFRVALESLNGRCVFASEYCRFASATYRSNWPKDAHSLLVGDIRRISPAQAKRSRTIVCAHPAQASLFPHSPQLVRDSPMYSYAMLSE